MKSVFLLGLVLVFLLLAAGGFWLIINYLNAECTRAIMARSRILGILCALIPLFLCCLFFKYNTITVIIAGLHLFVISLLTKGLVAILGRILHFSLRNDVTLGIGIVLTAAVLLLGFINMHNIRKTVYTVHTDKAIPDNGFRIAMISDVHLSTCINGEDFEKLISSINESSPDVLLICGDLVDESSKMQDLIKICTSLHNAKTKQGVYFAFGNHDNGIYGKREIPRETLKSALTTAGVCVLEDDVVNLDRFSIIGRSDASDRDRKGVCAFAELVDDDRFTILMDHQPNDYEKEAEAKIDLVLSGHTHGGQMFPAGQFGMLLGANDSLYGMEKRDQTCFIVSSGVSGWAIPFKTGTISEYVLIDVLPE